MYCLALAHCTNFRPGPLCPRLYFTGVISMQFKTISQGSFDCSILKLYVKRRMISYDSAFHDILGFKCCHFLRLFMIRSEAWGCCTLTICYMADVSCQNIDNIKIFIVAFPTIMTWMNIWLLSVLCWPKEAWKPGWLVASINPSTHSVEPSIHRLCLKP